MELPQYKHMRVANFCEKIKVCDSCFRAYQIIDKRRHDSFVFLKNS